MHRTNIQQVQLGVLHARSQKHWCTQVYGHGFLTRDGLKMGKALGNTLDPQVTSVFPCLKRPKRLHAAARG